MSEKNKWLTIGLSLLLILISVSYKNQVGASQCNSHNSDNCPIPTQVCGNGEHVGNPHCVTPTPTVEPTSTPVPTQEPCNKSWKDEELPCPTITVTPTATPEATITPLVTAEPMNSSSGDGRSDGLSSCPDCTKAHNYPNSSFDNQPVGWK